VTSDEAQHAALRHWWAMSAEALGSARDDAASGRLHRAVSAAYYACFYAATAVLAADGQRLTKHIAVQSAVHRDLVRPGRLEPRWGALYNALFEARQAGDYHALSEFEPDQVATWVAEAEQFTNRLRRLDDPPPG
jgi:uncharacterized protein (UPF0332 family)